MFRASKLPCGPFSRVKNAYLQVPPYLATSPDAARLIGVTVLVDNDVEALDMPGVHDCGSVDLRAVW